MLPQIDRVASESVEGGRDAKQEVTRQAEDVERGPPLRSRDIEGRQRRLVEADCAARLAQARDRRVGDRHVCRGR